MIPVGWSTPVELGPRSFSSIGIGNTPTYKPTWLAADLNLFPLRPLATLSIFQPDYIDNVSTNSDGFCNCGFYSKYRPRLNWNVASRGSYKFPSAKARTKNVSCSSNEIHTSIPSTKCHQMQLLQIISAAATMQRTRPCHLQNTIKCSSYD